MEGFLCQNANRVAKRRGSPPEIVCVLVVDIILDEFEVENLALTS